MNTVSQRKICEKALIALAKGDKKALSDIYDSMARSIFSLAYTLLGNYHDAEDVLQSTMIDVAGSAHTYSGGNACAWILSAARHNALDLLRKRKSDISLDGDEVRELADGEENFSPVETLDMLSVLDEDEKQIIFLRLQEKAPYAEIAEIMNTSVFAAQKKYQRALAKLKKYIPR